MLLGSITTCCGRGSKVVRLRFGRGGLQGVEKKGGGAVVDLIGQEEAHALHEGYLDRVRVF
jgi:hypothetical protein